jgi:hypothetical protein
MSKRETPMALWYWEQIGGTLVEEFPAVPPKGDRRIRPDDTMRCLGRSSSDAIAQDLCRISSASNVLTRSR